MEEKRNTSIEEVKRYIEKIKQAEIIAQNPSIEVNDSSKENTLGTIAATSSIEAKRWGTISPMSSYQSSGSNLGGSPTTSPTKFATSTPAEVPSNFVLSPSNNFQSDRFRDYRDSRDPILNIA